MAQRIEKVAVHTGAAATGKGAFLTSHGGVAAEQLMDITANRVIPAAVGAKAFLASHGTSAGERIKNIATEHPVAAAVIGTGAAVVAAPALLSTPALAAAGFSSSGITAGSLAATIHSGIGSVASGSAFATLQSAGAGGASLAIVNGVAQGVGVGAVTLGGLMGYFGGKGDQEEAADDETKSNEEREDQMEAQDL
ncbi:hypothetical protein J3459_007627 [Metarhizium acridum]|uniref:Interferon-induced 6-16 n=1 Tax=Metarhizium acridum (strain CQMa 102) TaxID=655827 RepID=E9DRJ3_METAQ|nr:uncharacterized protein MAC_00362 [Metarhizium acridum CQMa 102]EFY93871.1 hypothetical protein MAC_00362 [Metarhizium acridum CQMa 102]KAG8416505.1 hypothetical protein J3458_007088 [Metarhizium acridum]KAG8426959.1 hypothetical protein J3459_007627 [Metarhizium acridum]